MIPKSILARQQHIDTSPSARWGRPPRSIPTRGSEAASGLVHRILARRPLCLHCATIFFVSRRKCRSEQAHLLEVLSPEERQRACGIPHEGRRLHFIGGRAGLRCILSLLDPSGAPASRWRFVSGPHGKPYLTAPGRAWFFNLCHARDLTAVAVSDRVDVGIDIEHHRPIPSGSLPRHLLSNAERRLLAAVPASAWSGVFLRIWTAKEAVAKCVGLGSAADFATIDTCAVASTMTTWRLLSCGAGSYSIYRTDLPIDDRVYFLSIAVRSAPWPATRAPPQTRDVPSPERPPR